MKNDQNENDSQEDKTETGDSNGTSENDSSDDEYKRDESNRGERPDNLRQRSDWFQKRTGGR